MTRRDLIAGSSAFLAQSGAPKATNMIKPAALKHGDTVGLITPSTNVSDPDRLLLAQRTLEYFGLKPRMGKGVGKRTDYATNVQDRVNDVHQMFSDPEVKGVFCVRGGYGSTQIIDRLDYPLITRNPKVFVGFSDITAMHLAIHQKTGLITFHGPVSVSRFTGYTQERFYKALFETKPLGTITNPTPTDTLRPAHSTRTVRPGKARGRLIGGNLSLICATMGTPFEIDTRGKLLFIEDVGEQPYNID